MQEIIQKWVWRVIGLKKIRKAKNLNQQKVAMDLNISREALSHYENGKREPSLSLLVQMSQYFNVSINYLITGEEFKKKWPISKLILLIGRFIKTTTFFHLKSQTKNDRM